MSNMSTMKFTTLKNAVKEGGVSYIGNVSSSAKIIKNEKFNELTYIIYLAPANLSGYEVCPMRTEECTKGCLHESGHNKIDVKKNRINNARITKTHLFFQQREFFMDWVYAEIKRYKKQADKRSMKFSVRLNGIIFFQILHRPFNGKYRFINEMIGKVKMNFIIKNGSQFEVKS